VFLLRLRQAYIFNLVSTPNPCSKQRRMVSSRSAPPINLANLSDAIRVLRDNGHMSAERRATRTRFIVTLQRINEIPSQLTRLPIRMR